MAAAVVLQHALAAAVVDGVLDISQPPTAGNPTQLTTPPEFLEPGCAHPKPLHNSRSSGGEEA
tara:strand:- start:121 stop:309 length:189 start_codon:yes stop_codon:yes gene_type:complete